MDGFWENGRFVLRSTIEERSAKKDKEIERLRAENEALRKDAERYRWLRDHSWDEDDNGNKEIYFRCDFENWDNLDAAIDAAMKGE